MLELSDSNSLLYLNIMNIAPRETYGLNSVEGTIALDNYYENIPSGDMAKFYSFLNEKLIPGALEGSDKALKLIDQLLNSTQSIINKVIPTTGKIVTGFLPGHVSGILNKGIEYGTKGSTIVGKALIKGALNCFTLGAPAWIQGARQHLAVKNAYNLEEANNSSDITAISFIEHLKDEKLQNALREYYNLRKELAELRENPTKNTNRIEEISAQLASFELSYKDSVDFSNLKAVLSGGMEFIKNNSAFIDKLAEDTADSMISKVENFYKDKLGKYAGKVDGKWSSIANGSEEARAKLVQEISIRLKNVMSTELSSKEVQNDK